MISVNNKFNTLNRGIMADQDFTEKETPKTNFKPKGKSGTLITADTVQNDYLKNLIGEAGQETYAKMLLSDASIRKPYHAINNPIKSAKWDIEPASDEKKDLEVAALIHHILFNNVPDGWKAKLDEILTFPWHGHSVFEVVHKNRVEKPFGPYTGLANIAWRDQRTLDKWKFNREGILEKIHQTQSGDVEVNEDMDADTLLIFYNEKKGNDTGYPFCRMLYGNYKRKLLYKQLQAIGIEKGAIGVPVLTLPPGIDYESDEYKHAMDVLTEYTQAESAHIILPDGYNLNLDQANTFDPAKVQIAIKAENEEIAGAIIAMWLEMGIGGNAAVGSSTAQSVEFFRDGIEYIADKIADTINLNLIPNLVRLNFGDSVEVMPKLIHSGIADEAGEELMRVVTGYVEKGIITADEPLEDHVRRSHNLPKKADGDMLENKEAKNEDNKKSSNSSSNDNSDGGDSGKQEEQDDVELSEKGTPKTPRTLIAKQGSRIADDIRATLEFSSAKYINDVMNRYKQLADSKKQLATSKIKMSGVNDLKKSLKRSLTDTAFKAIDMAKKEIPSMRNVELNNHERDMIRMVEKYGESVNEIKLNDASKLPTYIQVLIQKQSDLISEDSIKELKKRIDFSYSGIETKSSDENVIRQSMEDDAEKFIESNQVEVKGNNSAALMVNEGRDAFFFEPDVLEEIHSFTFINIAPKSAICKELAGTTFNTNDAESLRYSPPLHHNCKSYLRANLKTSKGVDGLEVSTLSPSATAKKSITL